MRVTLSMCREQLDVGQRLEPEPTEPLARRLSSLCGCLLQFLFRALDYSRILKKFLLFDRVRITVSVCYDRTVVRIYLYAVRRRKMHGLLSLFLVLLAVVANCPSVNGKHNALSVLPTATSP